MLLIKPRKGSQHRNKMKANTQRLKMAITAEKMNESKTIQQCTMWKNK